MWVVVLEKNNQKNNIQNSNKKINLEVEKDIEKFSGVKNLENKPDLLDSKIAV